MAVLAALVLPGPAQADASFYRWTDAQGTVHFAECPSAVPAAYRDQPEDRASGRFSGIQHYPPRVHVAALSVVGPADAEIVIPFERTHGLMKVDVRLNDRLVAPFFIDTGASDVSIPKAVARRLGPDSETRTTSMTTAAGTVRVPVVTLDSVEFGGAREQGLEATINPYLDVGLLGASFFAGLTYTVDPAAGTITLRRQR